MLRFRPRWRGRIDELMGWWGGGDPLETLTLRFPTRQSAEDYARRQGIRLEVSEPLPANDACRRLAMPVAVNAAWPDPFLPWSWDGRAAVSPNLAQGDADEVDIDLVLLDPAAVFRDPLQVATHTRLTRAQKREILARWEWDARLIETAQTEGMPDGGEPSRLEEVLAARRMLEGADPARASLRPTGSSLRAAPARRFNPGSGLAA
ncbi:NADH dehydrogenase ubiquinone Fe-S protein 4 [Sabulicella rubraurantiaca]|uniref:NADH dehydrogenase ubiquinone Fe-S protein 4 n=1 Tax=Sabulicella rubraurantiaca TaxID=2811429 RepID=UPI001A964088|nr:NADH dehydrogenase ubiquinone Fe-S protein 4 [Sabulicella rubraurantiaca]